MVLENKTFISFPHYKSMETIDTGDVVSLDPRGLIGRIYVGDISTLKIYKPRASWFQRLETIFEGFPI